LGAPCWRRVPSAHPGVHKKPPATAPPTCFDIHPGDHFAITVVEIVIVT
jgi:hypothetical protein